MLTLIHVTEMSKHALTTFFKVKIVLSKHSSRNIMHPFNLSAVVRTCFRKLDTRSLYYFNVLLLQPTFPTPLFIIAPAPAPYSLSAPTPAPAHLLPVVLLVLLPNLLFMIMLMLYFAQIQFQYFILLTLL